MPDLSQSLYPRPRARHHNDTSDFRPHRLHPYATQAPPSLSGPPRNLHPHLQHLVSVLCTCALAVLQVHPLVHHRGHTDDSLRQPTVPQLALRRDGAIAWTKHGADFMAEVLYGRHVGC
jgi:hypothetical protein